MGFCLVKVRIQVVAQFIAEAFVLCPDDENKGAAVLADVVFEDRSDDAVVASLVRSGLAIDEVQVEEEASHATEMFGIQFFSRIVPYADAGGWYGQSARRASSGNTRKAELECTTRSPLRMGVGRARSGRRQPEHSLSDPPR